jgi:uncharacterized protein YdhG (YjbR/CyaY superfamily)
MAKKSTTTSSKKSAGFTADEKAAMKERARELKAQAQKTDLEKDLLAKIAELKGAERAMAERIHALVKANAPGLLPKTWYGMPAYADQDGKIVCFFQAAAKFNARYATFGFNDSAHLDDGDAWATAFAVKTLTPAVEAQIAALVRKAVS